MPMTYETALELSESGKTVTIKRDVCITWVDVHGNLVTQGEDGLPIIIKSSAARRKNAAKPKLILLRENELDGKTVIVTITEGHALFHTLSSLMPHDPQIPRPSWWQRLLLAAKNVFTK
jgi:hypothetical protein